MSTNKLLIGSRPWRSVLWLLSITALLILGAFIRLWDLAALPAQVHNDESSSIVDGIMHFMPGGRGGWALFGSAFGGHPNLSYWLNALPSRLIGEVSIWSSRLGAALAGIASLVALTLFVSKAFGRRVAIFFLIFIVPFHWHVHFSRTAFPYVHALLGMGLVSYALSIFLSAPSLMRALLTGISMGLAALAYPATHVLPAAIAVAVVIRTWPDLSKRNGFKRGSFNFIALVVCFVVGLSVALLPHVIYSFRYGYTSRLTSTFVLHPHNIRHLAPQTGIPNVSVPEVVWFNMKRTAKIFYAADTAEQYQFHQNPLPLWGAILATLGAVIMLFGVFRRDAVAAYLITTSALSFLASGLMVEGPFSPHLILFAAIIPISMAVGIDRLLSWIRIRQVALVGLVGTGLLIVWTDWNLHFYQQVVDPQRSRLSQMTTYLLRLPIDTRGVTTIVGASDADVSPNESYYKLFYPLSKQIQLGKGADVSKILDIVAAGAGPAVIVVDERRCDELRGELARSGKIAQLFRYPKLSVAFLYLN